MEEIYEFLKACKVYYLATTEGDQPRVRPFGTIDLFDGKLYIQTGRRKEVSHQMHENPQVELCAFGDGKWLRVEATAVPDDNRDAERHMLDAYPELQSLYAPGDGNTEVLFLRNVTATFSSFTEPQRVLRF